MTEICDRVLKRAGPALLFERPQGHSIPVLGNLFGTPRRVAMAMGEDSVDALREVGRLLAYLPWPVVEGDAHDRHHTDDDADGPHAVEHGPDRR